MKPFKIYLREDLTDEQTKSLDEDGISLDDADFVLVDPNHQDLPEYNTHPSFVVDSLLNSGWLSSKIYVGRDPDDKEVKCLICVRYHA